MCGRGGSQTRRGRTHVVHIMVLRAVLEHARLANADMLLRHVEVEHGEAVTPDIGYPQLGRRGGVEGESAARERERTKARAVSERRAGSEWLEFAR